MAVNIVDRHLSLAERWRNRRVPVVAGTLVIILLLGLLLWRSARTHAQEAPPPPPPPLPVAAIAVLPEQVPVSLKAIGTLRAVHQVTLTTEVPGRILRINFGSGTWVQRGHPIVQLNDRPEKASQRSFGTTAQLAAIQLARARELMTLGAESQETIDLHRAERQRAEAEIGRIDATIAQKTVYAPFSGTLGIRRVDLGQYLNPGDPIATLIDLGEMYVEFQIPQKHLSAVATGLPVTVTTDSWPDRRFVGRIEAIESQISEDSRNILVQARIDNRNGALRPGMYVDARLELGTRQSALMVPATAILSSANGESVIVVEKPDKKGVGVAKFVPVKTGDRIGNDVIILDGLAAGQYVVTAGQLRIRPDIPVRIASPKRPTAKRAKDAGGAR